MVKESWIRIGTAGLIVIAGGWVTNWLIAPSTAELVAEGRELFSHEWEVDDPLSNGGDGLGPVFNDKSCVACHFQGGVGGAGAAKNNVAAFKVLPNRNNHELQSGVIHASATSEDLKETSESVRQLYPAVPNSTRVVGGCTVTVKGFDPLLVEQINTPALYGVGLIDQISSASIKSARRYRELGRVKAEFALDFEQTRAGRVRTHGMGSVGKFGWQGQFASLEDFVATACAVELGLTNSIRAQDVPQEHRPDTEAEYDMTSQQLHALVTFCRELPRPEQVLPTDTEQLARVRRGAALFKTVGCADCHTPSVNGVSGVYSDFLLYSLEEDELGSGGYVEELEVPMPSHLPLPDEWQTPPLWGVADSAPYFHDGQSATLEAAIARHKGAAKHAMKQHKLLPSKDKENIVLFLKTLKAPATAEQIETPNTEDAGNNPN